MSMIERRPSTVGEIIRQEYLKPYGITIKELGELLGIHRNTINNLMSGQSRVSPLMAYKLAKLFNNSPEFWMNLQRLVDMWEIRHDPVAQVQLKQITTLSMPGQIE